MNVEKIKEKLPTYPKVEVKLNDDVFDKNVTIQTLLRKYLDGKYYLIPCRHLIPFEDVSQINLTNLVHNFHETMYRTLINFVLTEEIKSKLYEDNNQETEKERLADKPVEISNEGN